MELIPSLTLYLGKEKKVPIEFLDARLLRFIKELGSISKAAKTLGISYRNAWGRIKRLEKELGIKLVETKVGGKEGGRSYLTKEGEKLLSRYRRARKFLFNVIEELEFQAHIGYKISARNKIRAKVIEIKKSDIACEIKAQLTEQGIVTSLITKEAFDELEIKEGDEVFLIFKATDVVIAKFL